MPKKYLVYGLSSNREKKIRQLLDADLKGLEVLDLGCGRGDLAKILKDLGAKVTGVDFDKQSLSQAKRYLTKAVWVDLNKLKLPFKTNRFDLIVSSEVVEHLLYPNQVLKEIYRVLKPKGNFIVTTPNLLYWGNRLKILNGDFRYQDSGIFDRTHVHFYTYPTLIEDLKQAGFKIMQENHVFVGSKLYQSLIKKISITIRLSICFKTSKMIVKPMDKC